MMMMMMVMLQVMRLTWQVVKVELSRVRRCNSYKLADATRKRATAHASETRNRQTSHVGCIDTLIIIIIIIINIVSHSSKQSLISRH